MVKLVALASLLLVTACASTPPVGQDPNIALLSTSAMPEPVSADVYLVAPLDKLHIEVFGVPDLNREVQVDAAGRLSFPLVGFVNAAGRTPEQLAEILERELRDGYIREPQVSVNVFEAVNQLVTVDGQVEKPGAYPVLEKMTLARAVALAGGTTEFARLSDVVLFRTVQGRQYVGLYDLQAIRRGNYADPKVYPHDLIIVGDSPARRRFDQVLRIAPLLTTPLIYILR